MKKACLLIILLFTPLFASSCEQKEKNIYTEAEQEEFMKIQTTYINIYVHKKTRVMYISNNNYNGGGITLMVDEDGKPLLYEGEIE